MVASCATTLVVPVLFAALLSPAAAQERTYKSVNVDVPFKFKLNEKSRSFRPGSYHFLFVGTNLMALRDAKAHMVASLLTRDIKIGSASPATKLIFEHTKKNFYLARILIQDESRAIDILGEELAIPSSSPPEWLPPQGLSFNDRVAGPRLHR